MRRPLLMMPQVEQGFAAHANAPLDLWVVYRPNTTDFHGSWICRLHRVPDVRSRRLRRGTFHLGSSLDEVRAKLPAGLYNIGRQANDDETIEEVWL